MTHENFRQTDQADKSHGAGGNLSRHAWDHADHFDWQRGGGDTGSKHIPNLNLYDSTSGGGTPGESGSVTSTGTGAASETLSPSTAAMEATPAVPATQNQELANLTADENILAQIRQGITTLATELGLTNQPGAAAPESNTPAEPITRSTTPVQTSGDTTPLLPTETQAPAAPATVATDNPILVASNTTPVPASDASPPASSITPGATNTAPSDSTQSAPATSNANTTVADTTNPTTTTTTPATVMNAANGYNVINGQIIGPNGQPFDANGVAVNANSAQADAAAILQAMPNLNFIRLAAYPGQDSAADIQADIQAFQTINPNVVVEVQDTTSNGGDASTTNTLSGQALTDDENWYAQIAAANSNNPNVWFATPNEPNNATNEQAVVDEESGIVNAVRGTGSNAMVLLEANLGALFGPQQADPSAYASMTNVAWDDHYYGWETQNDADGGQTVQENVAGLQNEMAGAAGITESDGAGGQQKIPTIVGEYGNATTGLTIDPNGTAAVDGVQTANNEGLVQGAVAWEWDQYNPPGDANAITASAAPTTLTPYGQEIVNYVNSGAIGNTA